MKLTDTEILYTVEQEIQNSQGVAGDDISQDRSKAMDYYNGDMTEYLDVEEDRTNVVSRDVLDTVESVLPSMIKIFYDQDNIVDFQPVGPEDEPQAEQETAVVRHIFLEENEGFLNLYTFLKDALLSKNGIMKVCWVEDEWEREEYKGLDLVEVDSLLADQTREIEIEDYDATDQQNISITIKTRRREGHVEVMPTPPEEFGISRGAVSPDPGAATFSFHRKKTTTGELIEAGYDRDKIESLPFDDDQIGTDERLARYMHTDEQLGADNFNKVARPVWITEAYLKLDVKDDGIGILHKVTLAASNANFQASGAVLLDKEEVDAVPFFSASPVLRTHAFSGLSLADLVMDIQEIRTILLRAIVDNTLQTANQRTAANDNVVIDDLMTSRPGGIVRTKGKTPPGQNLMPIPQPQLPQQAFGLMELLEDTVKQRTGVGDEVQGLDTSALSNVNTGVIMAALEQSRMRIELMTRIIAEIGLKPLFRRIHELTKKNNTKPMAMKLKNEWVQIKPQSWRERTDVKVNVGIGRDSKAHKLAMLGNVYQQQLTLIQQGAPLVTPLNVYNTLTSMAKIAGVDSQAAWTDPTPAMQAAEAAKNQPPPPDPAMMQLQMMDKHKQADLQLESQKHQDTMQLKSLELQQKDQEGQRKAETEVGKNALQLEKTRVDEQSEVINAEANAAQAVLSAELKRQDQAWKQTHDEMKLELEKYKADLQALTALIKDAGNDKTLSYLEGEVNE